LKLNFSFSELSDFCTLEIGSNYTFNNTTIEQVVVDSRKIIATKNVLFCALKGLFYDGHEYIEEAYQKGIRLFMVDKSIHFTQKEDAVYLIVADTLWSFQEIAKRHREKFNFPIALIAGDLGKTMVKEWSYHLLSPEIRIIRSPKSFNTNLGVALSLLELNSNCDLAIIEVGEQKKNDLVRINEIIKPNLGIITSLRNKDYSHSLHLLFQGCSVLFVHPTSFAFDYYKDKINQTSFLDINALIEHSIDLDDKVKVFNIHLCIQLALYFKIDPIQIEVQLKSLPKLALRMETFEGVNGNTIINDTYNLDFDALIYSLEYQLKVSRNKKRVVIIGLDETTKKQKTAIREIIQKYNPEEIFFTEDLQQIATIQNAVVLIKGTRKANMQKIAQKFRLKNHKTYLEIDLEAVQQNIEVYKSQLRSTTKILIMVKSNAYGAGVEKMSLFYEEIGVDYLGVAYVDEGVELRNSGVTLPILVMNAEESGFEDCIQYNLEPAIYSFEQMDEFIKSLITQGVLNYPIHLKINTGMNRLGFELSEIGKVIETLKAQPEIKIKSVYSHLSDGDNLNSKKFTLEQIEKFESAVEQISYNFNYHFDKHILNSEATPHYSAYQYDMIRLGIGVYGYANNPSLKPKLTDALQWRSSISQIKSIAKGESVGYGRSFIAEKATKIAIIPVGYADGFRRSLSNGKGGVYIKGAFCPVLGRVCMDMIMVDIKDNSFTVGETVEIIGENQAMDVFAKNMETIPYEVMTNFSKRVHRIYLTK